ncbi:MAG TPA: FRG domain-containing protein [Desulfuromonadales bacterium]|nr:FRG domain-containing protein [Desulfuromonadales bacterium]
MLPTLLELVRYLQDEQKKALSWSEKNFGILEDGHFSAMAISESEFVLMPPPEFGALIYRGQNQYFEPCLASLYRKKTNSVERLINMIRLAEFELLLTAHPAVKDCMEWSLMGLSFKVDFEALAQHYLLQTSLLDFSSNPLVAAFFACCEFNKQDDHKYSPIISDKRPPGVLYSLNAAAEISARPDNPRSGTIGLQPLPRPAEQYAWSYRLPRRTSLNSQPFLSKYEFIHSSKDSITIFETFERGTKLFPFDPVSEKAHQIVSSKCFSNDALQLVIERSNGTVRQKSAMNDLARKGFYIIGKQEIVFSQQELTEIENDWDKLRPDLLSRIHWRNACYV